MHALYNFLWNVLSWHWFSLDRMKVIGSCIGKILDWNAASRWGDWAEREPWFFCGLCCSTAFCRRFNTLGGALSCYILRPSCSSIDLFVHFLTLKVNRISSTFSFELFIEVFRKIYTLLYNIYKYLQYFTIINYDQHRYYIYTSIYIYIIL